ncbi:MAG: glycosyltransferase [Aquaticitalea sp.]
MPSNKVRKKAILRFDPVDNNRVKAKGLARSTSKPSIVLLTTYPPRECGIATYSKDLLNHIDALFSSSFSIKIYALNTSNENPKYDENISYVLKTDSPKSFKKITEKINMDSSIQLVFVQHEFGLFHQNPAEFLKFIQTVQKPVVISFHTVLPRPDTTFKNYVQSLICHVDHIIVMTNSSKQILVNEYQCLEDMVSIISHGTHLIPFKNKEELKRRYGFEGKTVLSTFGLLGPGKSIETTLNALPLLIKEYPNLIFLIIGKTHPGIVKKEGEIYREFLKEKIETLNLTQHVKFINEFVQLDNLLEYLQLSDIYLFTSKDPNQAVSGTFAYAMSCGCPIISTPMPHALELLKEDKGLLFDFGNSTMLANHISKLLDDDNWRTNLGLNSLHASAANSWENTALLHATLFNRLKPQLKLQFNKPKLSLEHLYRMTTSVGILQFSKLNQPEIESGYTLDDNARALLVMCQVCTDFEDSNLMNLYTIYLSFIVNCQRYNGSFFNYVDQNLVFTEQNNTVNLDDSNGRALWALGEVISRKNDFPKQYSYLIENAEACFNNFLPNAINIHSPRATSFIIKGLYNANKTLSRSDIDNLIDELASKLARQYEHESQEDWRWFEDGLTYANGVIPEAMLIAFNVTKNPIFEEIALRSFMFLLGLSFKGSNIQVISNQTWYKRGDQFEIHPKGGQQAIDVAYIILALQRFHENYPERGFDAYMNIAFSWFLGNNHLNQTVYNPCTKGCYDGIEANNVNLNQGAESLVSYLLSRLAMID